MGVALLIDDNEDIRGAVERALTRWGYEVVVADNGRDGLRLAQEGEFDVIVCDLEMPGLWGNQVFAQLSPEQQSRFVLHTGDFEAVEKYGAQMTVLEKSGAPSKLKDVLDRLPQGETR